MNSHGGGSHEAKSRFLKNFSETCCYIPLCYLCRSVTYPTLSRSSFLISFILFLSFFLSFFLNFLCIYFFIFFSFFLSFFRSAIYPAHIKFPPILFDTSFLFHQIYMLHCLQLKHLIVPACFHVILSHRFGNLGGCYAIAQYCEGKCDLLYNNNNYNNNSIKVFF
jgi:hypothetical protein